jgi:hypothetical protein
VVAPAPPERAPAHPRLEILPAVLLAAVGLVAALVAWRISVAATRPATPTEPDSRLLDS